MKRVAALRSVAIAAVIGLLIAPQSAPLTAVARTHNPIHDPGLGVVHPGDGVELESTEIIPTLEVSGDGNIFYLVKFKYTNNLGQAFYPVAKKFVLEDDQKERHAALESGSPELVGISNNFNVQLKPGDTHEYTLGFRVQLNTEGTLFYDPT